MVRKTPPTGTACFNGASRRILRDRCENSVRGGYDICMSDAAGQQFLFDELDPGRENVPVSAESVPATAAGVTVREVRCKSLLNPCGIADYSFNCYVGCQHGCGYCYARFMQRFHPHEEEWGRFVDVRVNAPAALTRQLKRMKPGAVFTCSACDGWQPLEERYRLTRECCRLLLDAGFNLTVLTKSRLVLRDLDLFTGRNVLLGVTIATPDEAEARVWEGGASSVADRAGILHQAKAAGLETSVMFAPLLPGISDTPAALEKLFSLAAHAKVDRIWTDGLNARPRVWPSVQELLRRHRPDLHEEYQRILFDREYRRKYKGELRGRIRRAAREAGVVDRMNSC